MTKSTVLFSALVALVAIVSTSTAFADDSTLQCGMLASAGQPLPPYCAKNAPTKQQAAAPVAKKKSQASSPTAPASTTTKPHSIEVTVTLDESGTPKKVGYETTATKMPIGKTSKPRRLAMR